MATTSTNVWWSQVMQSAGIGAAAITATSPTITGIARLDTRSSARSESMWTGVAYPGKAQYFDGVFDKQTKLTNCQNCGARLNWLKDSCEYCRTFYAK